MKSTQVTTAEQFNNLIEFRQRVYEHGLTRERDGQFELVDVLITRHKAQSFAELSLSPLHRRRWSSAYSALERGEQDREYLTGLFVEQLPDNEVMVFALDASKWAHANARTLSELVLEPYGDTRHIVPVHVYSMLALIPQAHSSWALPVSTRRVRPDQTQVQVGAEQIRELCELLPGEVHKVITLDGRYGNHKFVKAMADVPVNWVVRLAKNRVLYGDPGPYSGFGRPRKHGHRFDFKDPTTWPLPIEDVEFEHPTYGQVRLRCWKGLHDKKAPDLPFCVIYAQIHLERECPPDPLWLGSGGPYEASMRSSWTGYTSRWPIEPAFRFRKQQLHWTLPRFQQTERCDRWTMLIDIAVWQVWLARDLVQDRPLPWQKPQLALTPGRILHGMAALLATLPSLTSLVQTRGKSPGWLLGRPRLRPIRFPVVKRARASP